MASKWGKIECVFFRNIYLNVEGHLKARARQGWLLQDITPFCWYYQKDEPQELEYHVVYLPESAELGLEETAQEKELYQRAKKSGWDFVGKWQQMQIFSTDDKTAPSLEQNEMTHFQNMCSVLKWNAFGRYTLFIMLSIINLLFEVHHSPLRSLDLLGVYFEVIAWATIFCSGLFGCLGYLFWYRKAKKVVHAGECCPAVDNIFFKISTACFVLFGLLFVGLCLFLIFEAWFWAGRPIL